MAYDTDHIIWEKNKISYISIIIFSPCCFAIIPFCYTYLSKIILLDFITSWIITIFIVTIIFSMIYFGVTSGSPLRYFILEDKISIKNIFEIKSYYFSDILKVNYKNYRLELLFNNNEKTILIFDKDVNIMIYNRFRKYQKKS